MRCSAGQEGRKGKKKLEQSLVICTSSARYELKEQRFAPRRKRRSSNTQVVVRVEASLSGALGCGAGPGPSSPSVREGDLGSIASHHLGGRGPGVSARARAALFTFPNAMHMSIKRLGGCPPRLPRRWGLSPPTSARLAGLECLAWGFFFCAGAALPGRGVGARGRRAAARGDDLFPQPWPVGAGSSPRARPQPTPPLLSPFFSSSPTLPVDGPRPASASPPHGPVHNVTPFLPPSVAPL